MGSAPRAAGEPRARPSASSAHRSEAAPRARPRTVRIREPPPAAGPGSLQPPVRSPLRAGTPPGRARTLSRPPPPAAGPCPVRRSPAAAAGPAPGGPRAGGGGRGGAGTAPGPRGGRTRAPGRRAAHLPQPAGDAGPRSSLARTARPDPPPPEPAGSGRNRARWPELSPPRRQRRASLQRRGRRDPRVAPFPPQAPTRGRRVCRARAQAPQARGPEGRPAPRGGGAPGPAPELRRPGHTGELCGCFRKLRKASFCSPSEGYHIAYCTGHSAR
ncbi:translation initiation factor IF-2-like [Panthera pardus]|uniref:Translation initiation factor IF-2-like n=1 Tax=Panthera pardus TaxID=9691 RepID=A0A9W2UHP7_PANPR|nr:translation initiation factor IF-2-like [Panthera pardus]